MSVAPPTPPRTEIASRLTRSLFFFVFLAVGLGFTYATGRGIWKNAVTYTWSATACVIEESRVDQTSGGKPTLLVRYRYRYLDREHVSSQLSAGISSTSDAAEIWRRHETLAVGTNTVCYVNPNVPGDAVLERTSLWTALFIFFPLTFVAVGGGGLYATWRRRPVESAMPRPLTSNAAGKERRWPIVAFFLLFFVVGAGMTIPFFVLPLLRIIEAREWPATPCTIVSSRVESHSDHDGTTYAVGVVYEYTLGGRKRTAARYSFIGGSSSGYAGKAAIVARLPSGTQTVCFVDPKDPANAVLERGATGEIWFGLIPLLFMCVGAGGAIFFIRAARRGAAGALARPLSSSWQSSPAVAAAPRSTSTDASPDGEGSLRPAQSRRGKLFGLIFGAVFWNGIVSVFVVNVVSEWRHGGSPWFNTLFLTPFVAIGLVLIYSVVRETLALFNPKSNLTLAPRAVPVGGTARLDWTTEGNVEKLRTLTITLEGREEATYRRGTDTKTDRQIFATVPVVTLTERLKMRQGSTHLTVPADTMHSFAAPNNRIVWVLRVRGEVPHWPDLDDEFPIEVAAKVPAAT